MAQCKTFIFRTKVTQAYDLTLPLLVSYGATTNYHKLTGLKYREKDMGRKRGIK